MLHAYIRNAGSLSTAGKQFKDCMAVDFLLQHFQFSLKERNRNLQWSLKLGDPAQRQQSQQRSECVLESNCPNAIAIEPES